MSKINTWSLQVLFLFLSSPLSKLDASSVTDNDDPLEISDARQIFS